MDIQYINASWSKTAVYLGEYSETIVRKTHTTMRKMAISEGVFAYPLDKWPSG